MRSNDDGIFFVSTPIINNKAKFVAVTCKNHKIGDNKIVYKAWESTINRDQYLYESAKMRELRALCATLLILLSGNALLCSAKGARSNNVTRVTKNAAIEITTSNGEVHLNLLKKDGTFTKNILFTRDDDAAGQPLFIDPDCAPHTSCIMRGNEVETRIETLPEEEIIKISRAINNTNGVLTDCYELADNTEWFGGPQMRYQHWPIQHMYYEEEPYLPTHPTNMALAERYWLNSKGFWIWVTETVPLFLDQNNILDKYICLVARNRGPYRYRAQIRLDYTIGYSTNARTAHESVVSQFIGKPTGHPDRRMIEHPVWSTWARYKVNVSESVVNEFADEIVSNGFKNSQLEIDDNWETCYGSAVFDPRKFPNVTRLTAGLKKKGFRVTLWIHPFINEGCEPAYSEALKNGYLVKNLQGQVRMSWWQGMYAATIDFSNPKAVTWWTARLRLILKSGIDGFKFDAGEVSWLPQVPALTGVIDRQPGLFTTDYVTALANNFGNLTEVRVGWRTQKLPIFVRMIDKDTKWTWNNGLPTLITTLLQMNLNGYVNVLPDMIGGNGYLDGSLNGTFLPTKELFLRWLQANTFMPSLQYSFVPWDFDNETIAISRVYTDLHALATPLIVSLMETSMKTGAPVNPPVWWIAPNDTTAHKINDAYLLGEYVLVAPVTREGAVARDVYLPAGRWKDPYQNKTLTGPVWLRNYPAPVSVLPFFVKEVNGTYAL